MLMTRRLSSITEVIRALDSTISGQLITQLAKVEANSALNVTRILGIHISGWTGSLYYWRDN